MSDPLTALEAHEWATVTGGRLREVCDQCTRIEQEAPRVRPALRREAFVTHGPAAPSDDALSEVVARVFREVSLDAASLRKHADALSELCATQSYFVAAIPKRAAAAREAVKPAGQSLDDHAAEIWERVQPIARFVLDVYGPAIAKALKKHEKLKDKEREPMLMDIISGAVARLLGLDKPRAVSAIITDVMRDKLKALARRKDAQPDDANPPDDDAPAARDIGWLNVEFRATHRLLTKTHSAAATLSARLPGSKSEGDAPSPGPGDGPVPVPVPDNAGLRPRPCTPADPLMDLAKFEATSPAEAARVVFKEVVVRPGGAPRANEMVTTLMRARAAIFAKVTEDLETSIKGTCSAAAELEVLRREISARLAPLLTLAFRAYAKRLTEMVIRRGLETEADDVVQCAFISFSHLLVGYRGQASFWTQLVGFAIALHKGIRRAQAVENPMDASKLTVSVDADDAVTLTAPPEWDPEVALERAQTMNSILDAFQCLDDEERDVIQRHHLDGELVRDLADAYMLTDGGMGAKLFRARERFEKTLVKHGVQIRKSAGKGEGRKVRGKKKKMEEAS